VTQQQEIAVMRLGVGDQLPPSAASPAKPASVSGPPSMSHDAMAMSRNATSHH